MKYKVGDRVRVRRELDVDGSYKVEENPYWWSEEMLEDIVPTKEINITIEDNRITHAKLIENGEVKATAIAKRHPLDKFNLELGIELALKRLFEPKGKYVPKFGETYWYLSAIGDIHCTKNDGSEYDGCILNNALVFRTEEEAKDYKLFKKQVAELIKPFAYGNENFIFYYDHDDKELTPTSWQTLYFGTPIFGYTIEEIENARNILGDDRIKKYLLDIWE